MRKKFFARIVAAILSLFVLTSALLVAIAAEPVLTSSGSGEEDYVKETLEILSDIKWAEYREKYASAPSYNGKPITVRAVDYSEHKAGSGEGADSKFGVIDELDGRKNVLMTTDAGSVTWTFDVPESGLYAIEFGYYPISERATNVERTLRINGHVPVNEVRNIVFPKRWTDNYLRNEEGKIYFEEDGNHNEKRPSKVNAPEWLTYSVCDPTGYYSGDFYFYLEKGTNTITLEAQKEALVLETVTLRKRNIQKTYAEYLEECRSKGYTAAPAGSKIYIEAEHYSATSDGTLYAVSDSTSSITSPQHACYQRLNTIGGSNWSSTGQWYEWTITVEEGKAGMYTINPRYLQNAVAGLFVSRRLRVDGKVPFEEANNLEFTYDKSWQIGPLSDGTTEFEIYLSEGKHTFSLEVTLGHFGEIYSEVSDCLTKINAIYLKILQITGTNPDSYMNYEFYTRIPNEIAEMKVLSERLTALSEEFRKINKNKASSNSATLLNVAQILAKMNRDSEGQIAKNFTALKNHIGTLGTWLNNITEQSLTIDYIVVQPAGDKLPKANGNFFQEFAFEVKAFAYSFVYNGYSFASSSGDHDVVQVSVWTTVSREYAQIIRDLIDEDFGNSYPYISVNLKLVAGGTLLPATLAGVGPDVMMGEGQTTVIDYAVRGALLDVSGYDGFEELKSRFSEASMTPLTVALDSTNGQTAVYGIPQAQSFNVMFYRKDILAELGISIPQTWTEFKSMVPKLQSKNYMVGLGTSGAATTTFYMFMYQNGGSLYTDGGRSVSFGEDASLRAFDQMCRFYTQYRFPITYDSANRFRTGEMPVLIADYISFYNQFTIYATELKGLWGFTLLPGVEREDGTVNHATPSAVSAMVLMKDAKERGTDEAGFCFMEWWMRDNIQSRYANELIALLGPAGKYATANVNAFDQMSWTASEVKELKRIIPNLYCVNEMPGSYIISRYVGFAFLAVYNKEADPAESIMTYINTINSEMDRKREELSRQFYIPSKSSDDDKKDA